MEPAVRSLHEQTERLGESLRVPIGQFAREVERLPQALVSFKQGADTIGRIGADLEAIGSASESLQRGVAALARIETLLAQMPSPEAQLEEIKRGLERAGASIDTLSGSCSAAYERSSRATQEQLARSLTSLKDALELLEREHGTGQRPLSEHRQEAVRRADRAGSHRPDSIRVA